jgi:hypothetical protein
LEKRKGRVDRENERKSVGKDSTREKCGNGEQERKENYRNKVKGKRN